MKKYYTMNNVGRSKYVVCYHDGISTHKDGSSFFDIKIFRNKKNLNSFIAKIASEGYSQDGINR